ncbi:MAG: nucleotide-binding protein [Candidatus Aenigmarchaeota archaeon]|nr:nucleotide-binding protein [Candidatus Aenigmarchaeota archaeon]
MKALLDTNFLMIPGEFGVDILSELLNLGYTEIFTLDLVVDELKRLSVGKAKVSRNARIGLEFVRKGEIVILETKGKQADQEILEFAKTREFAICTQDKELINKVKRFRGRVITLRQGKYLTESGK